MNKLEATREWVKEFNAVSQSLIERAFKDNVDSLIELTPIVDGNDVYYNGDYYTVDSVDGRDYVYLETSENIEVDIDDVEAVVYNGEELSVIEVDYEKETIELDTMDVDKELIIPISDVQEVVYEDKNIKVIESNGDTLELDYSLKKVEYDEVEKECYSWLPMWGTMWTFPEGIDEDWARENLDLVAKCGFRIYEDYETGDIYIGIDGAGYNFYEAHWVPLYEARGLKWHSDEAETC